jgi:hypothetical protein
MTYVVVAYLPVLLFGGGLLIHGSLKLRREKLWLAEGRKLDEMYAQLLAYGKSYIEPLVLRRDDLSTEQLKDLSRRIDEFEIWGEAISVEAAEWKAKQP